MKKLMVLLTLVSFNVFADAQTCAVVYNSLNHDYTSQLVLGSGERVRDLNRIPLENTNGDWDNRISAVHVYQGCTLIAYQYQNFNVEYGSRRKLDGFSRVFENSNQRGYKYIVMDSEVNDKISSLKCYCPN